MAWSLSQEDDGLEPVHGPVSTVQYASSNLASSFESDPAGSSGLPPGAAPLGAGTSRRRAQEPTLILRERQLDSLRAQVLRHRRLARFKRHVGTLLWVAAGGLAVLVGAFLARGARAFLGADVVDPSSSISESNSAPPLDAASLADVSARSDSNPTPPTARAPEASRAQSASARPSSPASSQRQAAPKRAALRLDEIPTE